MDAQFSFILKSAIARRILLLGISFVLIAATFIIFWTVVSCDFINFDDPLYFSTNPHVLEGLTRDSLAWAFRNNLTGNWHPIAWISLMLDVELFGKTARGPHLVNLCLHTANAVLLFLLLRKITGAIWRSAFVAALFALHPLHVESVAWISERKDVLSTLFFLLTIWTYVRFATVHVSRFTSRVGWYLLTLIFFALGLMSKPMLVTLPFVLLLLDYWPLNRFDLRTQNSKLKTFIHLFTEKIPFFLLAAASCVITFIAQKEGGAIQSLARLSIAERFENALISYMRYLGKTIWPLDLTIFYPHPVHWPWVEVALAAVLLAVVTIVAIRFARRLPFLFVGWFWFVGMLIPVIGLIQVGAQSIADRYTYVPLIGIFIIVAWSVCEATVRVRHFAGAIRIVAALVVFVCAVRTRDQLRHWQDTETLFGHALAVTKNNSVAHRTIGGTLMSQGRLDDAIQHFRIALELDPTRGQSYTDLGNAMAAKGGITEATELYRQALRVDPNSVEAHNNLGVAMAAEGRLDEAINHYRRAIEIAPGSGEAHDNWGVALARQGQLDEAIGHYHKALELNKNDLRAHNNLGNALARQGRVDEAIQHYEAALRLVQNSPETHNNLGAALLQRRQTNAAIVHFKEALRLRPGYTEPKESLRRLEVEMP